MRFKLLTEQHLELLSLKGGCIGSSESTLDTMPHCWKSRVAAQIRINFSLFVSPVKHSRNIGTMSPPASSTSSM